MVFQTIAPAIDKWILRRIYQSVGSPPIRLQLGNGVTVSPTDVSTLATIGIKDRKILLSLILNPEIGFGEAYREGRLVVEGDLIAALGALYQSMGKADHHNWYSKVISRCMEFFQRNSLRGSRDNIRQHYDLPTDFYRLWLDPGSASWTLDADGVRWHCTWRSITV